MDTGDGHDGRLVPLVDVVGILVLFLVKKHVQKGKAPGVTGADAEQDGLPPIRLPPAKTIPFPVRVYFIIVSVRGKRKFKNLRGEGGKVGVL